MSPPPTRSCMHAFSFSWLSRAAIRGNRRQAGNQLFPGRYCAPKWGESELQEFDLGRVIAKGQRSTTTSRSRTQPLGDPTRQAPWRSPRAARRSALCPRKSLPGSSQGPGRLRPGDGSGPRRVQFLVAANGSQGNYALGLGALSGLGDSGSERPYHHVPDEPR